MHYLVRFIVRADNAHQAASKVTYILGDLVNNYHQFDYYQPTAERSAWKDCWKPTRLSTKKGQAMVQAAIDGQLREFKQTLANIRLMLDGYTDEQIFNEEFEQVDGHYLSRTEFSLACRYGVSSGKLYDEDGMPILSKLELDRYIKDTSRLWVVQVDCHS